MPKKINETLKNLIKSNLKLNEVLKDLGVTQLEEIADSGEGIFYKQSKQKEKLVEAEAQLREHFNCDSYEGDPFLGNFPIQNPEENNQKTKLIAKITFDTKIKKLNPSCKLNQYTKNHRKGGGACGQVLGIHGCVNNGNSQAIEVY